MYFITETSGINEIIKKNRFEVVMPIILSK